jgi:hypothetical protein
MIPALRVNPCHGQTELINTSTITPFSKMTKVPRHMIRSTYVKKRFIKILNALAPALGQVVETPFNIQYMLTSTHRGQLCYELQPGKGDREMISQTCES